MRIRLFKLSELTGIGIAGFSAIMLRGVYELSGRSLAAAVFLSANFSVWEQLKPLLLCYFLYGGLELFGLKPYFRRFTASKAIGLLVLSASYITLSLLTRGCFDNGANVFISLFLSFVASRLMTLGSFDVSKLFYPACFLIFLIFMMFFCFTVCPPELPIFRDPSSGLFGIIPEHIDSGAIILNSVYY